MEKFVSLLLLVVQFWSALLTALKWNYVRITSDGREDDYNAWQLETLLFFSLQKIHEIKLTSLRASRSRWMSLAFAHLWIAQRGNDVYETQREHSQTRMKMIRDPQSIIEDRNGAKVGEKWQKFRCNVMKGRRFFLVLWHRKRAMAQPKRRELISS